MKIGTKDIPPLATPAGPVPGGLIILTDTGIVCGGVIEYPEGVTTTWMVEDLLAPIPRLLESGRAAHVALDSPTVHAVRNTIDRAAAEATTALAAERQRRVGVLDAVDAMMRAYGRSPTRE